uniref:TIR domain-containing protein n=1 Tax=Quercus lobata TaxID=97700 RepID=A0A7N2RAY1_QUELO
MALLPSYSCSSSSSKGGKYDVFLSFRGEDTRKRFTNHLYTTLKQKGISTFKDDEKLKRGTSITPELLKAIEESRFAMIILSWDYASSKWCLIVLTKIVECMKKTGLVVLPVFHYVDPSDVRNHRGTFAEAFDKHEESFKDNMRNIETWKAALTKVADLAGWDLKDKYESKVIQEIIGRICTELYHKFSSVYEDLVGMDSCVEEMLGSYLGEGLGDVRFVGICGMGGMGKTTLAQEIYRRISGNFEASSFIANIREETKNQGMHDLLQDMGQEIIRRESPREPGGRSRLWIYEDVIRVLKNNTGTEAIEGIMLKFPIQKMEHLRAEAFSKMKNLRLLKIGNEKFPQDFINGTMQLPKDLNMGKVQFLEGLSYLSNELRVIEWHGYHLKCLPTNFQPNKLVELRMHCSGIKQLWKGNLIFDELNLIDLNDSQNLIKTLDFSRVPNLKQLILQHCIRLSKIHASLGNLKWLTRLDVNGCLEELDVSGTAITELPSSIVLLKNLKVLSLCGCEGLSSMSSNKIFSFTLMPKRRVDPTGMLEHSLSNLWSLTKLNLSYCNLQAIPDSLGCLHSLSHLDLRANIFVGLPESTTGLSNLKSLFLSGCTHLRSLPKLPLNNHDIYADGCTSLDTLPLRPDANFHPFIHLVNCTKLIDNQDYPDICLAMLRNYLQSQNYHPIVQSFNEERKEELSQADDIFTQIEIKFETDGPGLEVMKCGGRLIFEQDIEDLNQTMPRCSNSSSCSITPYEDDFEGSAKDTKTKRSRDDNDGTSGEVCWRGEILALPGSEKICTTDRPPVGFIAVGLACQLAGILSVNSVSLPEFVAMVCIGRHEVGAIVNVAGKGHHWIDRLKESIVIDYEHILFPL